MKKRSIIIFLVLILIPTGLVYAQSSPNYILKSSVVSGGGDYSSSTHYRLISTTGQSSAIGISSSTQYVNYGGFWYTVPWQRFIFLPLIMKQ
jgi:hypothetical protein